jgi:3-(3-hydroxy-phenyl)propionate hydroxylase
MSGRRIRTPRHRCVIAVVVMGGGPIGVATALDLGLQGIPVVVLDDHEGIGQGSRAICFSKRCLEIADRYGCGEPMLEKGVVWNLGKVFHEDRKVYEFNLLPEEGHKYPAFINLQQPYFEKFIVEQRERSSSRRRTDRSARARTASKRSRCSTTMSC